MKIRTFSIFLLVLLGISAVFGADGSGVTSDKMVARYCTDDVLECPDGSYVGRIAPSCEFAPCPDEPVACTMDAMECPDGSYVGRIGPDCEFAPCPEEQCATYVVGGEKVEACAVCGNAVCEEFEECTSSSCTSSGACTKDCGHLYCPSDCEVQVGCPEDAMECPDGSYVIRVGPDCEFEKCPVGMANPASVYCVKRGGSLEIIDEPEGQVGYCTLPDGTVCEEWAYFRGECGSSEGPICGNGICEEGEGSSGQDCKLGYDCEAMYRGTCPEDCGMGIVTIEIPSKFSLTLGQSARIGVYHMTLTSVMQSDQMVCQSLNCPKPKQMAVLTLSIKRPYLRGAEAGNEGVQETVEVSEPGSSGSAGEMSKPTVGIRREDALPPTNIRAIDPERKVLSVGESFVYGGAKITLAGVSGNEARFTAEKSACDCTKEKCAECTAEAPICRIDTGVQGWYLGDELISKANCICTAICKLEGTRSEGFYSSCDGSLIKYEQCKFTRRYWEDVKVKPIEGGGYQVTSNATATSLRRVFVENGVVTVETDNGTAEIKFLPEEAAAIARENKRFVEIRKIEIDTKDGVPVYKVRGTVDSRFLWIFPITREEDVTVNAQTSEVIN